jgi:hypothetical protein
MKKNRKSDFRKSECKNYSPTFLFFGWAVPLGTLILTIHFGREKDIWIKGPQLTNRDYLNDTTNAGS